MLCVALCNLLLVANMRSTLRNRKSQTIKRTEFTSVLDTKWQGNSPRASKFFPKFSRYCRTRMIEREKNTKILSEMLELLQMKDKGEPKDYVIHNPFPKQREDPVVMYVRINLNKIGDIDTVRQEFQCEFYMRLRWKEKKLQDTTASEKEKITWESVWDLRVSTNPILRVTQSKA